jgi:hypothetical protein
MRDASYCGGGFHAAPCDSRGAGKSEKARPRLFYFCKSLDNAILLCYNKFENYF